MAYGVRLNLNNHSAVDFPFSRFAELLHLLGSKLAEAADASIKHNADKAGLAGFSVTQAKAKSSPKEPPKPTGKLPRNIDMNTSLED